MTVHSGEIIGIAGVEGNGQQELAEALMGLRTLESGQISVDGMVVRRCDPQHFRQRGVRTITEDRLGSDVCVDLSVRDNLILTRVALGNYRRHGLLDLSAITRDCERLVLEYGISPPDSGFLVAKLSGGNQQKVVLARETSGIPRVLIASQPTRGLDVVSARDVHRKLAALSTDGCAIVLVTHDLEELFRLADRIAVLYRGKVVYASSKGAVTMRHVAAAMSGLTP
jgi:simple sugar transport system ATP-binding protein